MSTESTSLSHLALIRLMHLVSPALPIGAFAYSQGLESAVDLKWIHDRKSGESWILGQLTHGIGRLDLPVFQRLYQAWQEQNDERLHYWAHYLQASRESVELQVEEQQLGRTMARLLASLNVEGNFDNYSYSYTALFSCACHKWAIPLEQAAHGFVWSWLEKQVTAASKLIPLGQTDAQTILVSVAEKIPSVVAQSLSLSDDDIGSSLVGLAVASQLHETQYSRLFRS